ncbi:MAG: hypothetical protein EBY40_08670 [Marivivens sp.]|nr:hypothetical protein [Marivivens sp.]
MPKIYDGTTGVVTENGKPAVEFDGSNDTLNCAVTSSDIITTNAENTVAAVMNQNSASLINPLTSLSVTTPRYVLFTDYDGTLYYDSGNNSTNRISTAIPSGWDDTQHLLFWSCSLSAQQIRVDGTQLVSDTSQTTITATAADLRIGQHIANYFQGTMQELIFYNSDEAANETNIEDNINTFYNIY